MTKKKKGRTTRKGERITVASDKETISKNCNIKEAK